MKSIENSDRKLKWTELIPDQDNKMLKNYEFCGHEINLQKRNYKSNGPLLFFPSAEAGSGTDEKVFISKEAIDGIIEKKANAQNFQFIRSTERDFPAIIIYMFSLAVVEPYSSQDWTIDNLSVEIPFDLPTVGLSVSFPILENDQNLSAREMRALNNSSKVSYQVGSIWRQQLLEFHMEDEYLEE